MFSQFKAADAGIVRDLTSGNVLPATPKAEWRNPGALRRARRYRFRTLATRAVRHVLNPWVVKCTARRDYDLRKTLVIAGSPRSGTTWLAELVATVPRTAILFEPLHTGNVPEAAVAGFRWGKNYLEPGEAWPEGEAFLERVLRGEIVNGWTMSFTPLARAVRPERWLVKFVRANLLLGWLAERFPIRPPVLIVRHPCATIASWLEQGWRQPEHPPRALKIRAAHPHLADLFDQLRQPIEFLAARWCVEQYVPLSLPRPYPFHIVAYERLVRDGERELARILGLWGIQMPPGASRRIRLASQSAKKDSAIHQREDPLVSWRRKLTGEQAEQILQVVKAFRLDFYTESPEPDYDRLYGPPPIGPAVLASEQPETTIESQDQHNGKGQIA